SGADVLAPLRPTLRPAAAIAQRRASAHGRPSARATARAPANVSPAAVVSTTSTGRAGTCSSSPSLVNSRQPSPPSVTATAETRRSSAFAADRTSGSPVSLVASPSFGTSTSTASYSSSGSGTAG